MPGRASETYRRPADSAASFGSTIVSTVSDRLKQQGRESFQVATNERPEGKPVPQGYAARQCGTFLSLIASLLRLSCDHVGLRDPRPEVLDRASRDGLGLACLSISVRERWLLPHVQYLGLAACYLDHLSRAARHDCPGEGRNV